MSQYTISDSASLKANACSCALSIAAPFLRFEPYLRSFKTLLWNTVANYELSVVPLYVLMGYLAAHAHLSRDLFQGLNALTGEYVADARVQFVDAFPDKPGRWQVVDSFPDFTVQVVDSFPDFEVRVVESFPGCR